MSILNNSIRCKVFMQILQLIQETESWMYRQGFQKTTVDLGYRPHWNRLRRLVGDEAEFSQCNLPESVRSMYGKDIFSAAPYERSRTESNAWRALSALVEFDSSGHVARSSRNVKLSGKPLTPESFNISTKYKGHLLGAGHTETTIRNNMQIIHRFLADCPIETVSKETILDYINGYGRYRKLTAATYRGSLQRFLEFCQDNGFLPIMLMYSKEASNRKQEIDRQHHTIPNQRPKDKHHGNVHNRLWNPSCSC